MKFDFYYARVNGCVKGFGRVVLGCLKYLAHYQAQTNSISYNLFIGEITNIFQPQIVIASMLELGIIAYEL
jgi:hypothetical protein